MSPSIKKSISLLIDESPENRIKALREISSAKATEYISDIIRILEKDEDDLVKIEAVISLRKMNGQEAGDLLISLLQCDDIPLLMEIVLTLGEFCASGYSKALNPLEGMLNHSNFRVRKFTIEALGKCGSSNSIELLYDHMKQENISIETKQLCATAIGQIGGSRSIEILKQLLTPNDQVSDSIMEVRRAAISALGDARNPAALEILGKVYNDKLEHKIIKKYAEEAIKQTILGAQEKYLAIKNRATDILKGKT